MITSTPTSLNFGNQALQQASAAQMLNLQNTGTARLVINGITSSNAGYSIGNCQSYMMPGDTCSLSVVFTPAALGTQSGSIAITSNIATKSISLTGVGVAATAVSPTSLAFGSQALGVPSAAKTITLTNNQSTPLAASPSPPAAITRQSPPAEAPWRAAQAARFR